MEFTVFSCRLHLSITIEVGTPLSLLWERSVRDNQKEAGHPLAMGAFNKIHLSNKALEPSI